MSTTMQIIITAARDGGLVAWIDGAEDPAFGGDHGALLKYLGERANDLLKAAAGDKGAHIQPIGKPIVSTRLMTPRVIADALVEQDEIA
jgi:hypothetical protein